MNIKISELFVEDKISVYYQHNNENADILKNRYYKHSFNK